VRILVVNAGSSTLKLAVLDQDELVLTETLPAGEATDLTGLERVISRVGPLDGVGHRIVHGGSEFTGPVLIDRDVRRRIEELADLAPLHQPKSLRALDATVSLLPDVPAVASFDTAFHAGMPREAATYALPAEWRRRWALRRYGFHGLSHAYASRRAAELVSRPVEELRVVTCHLGAGASVAAVLRGSSVDTTMGFTPLEGLVMATRSGTVDPGLLLWLEEHAGLSPGELADALEHRSGLLGLAGTSDLERVLEGEAAGNQDAVLAVGVYLHRLIAAIAAMAAAMDGLDVLVFTGGVGENSAPIRARTASRLGHLGIQVDSALNSQEGDDRDVSAPASPGRTVVVRAREDRQIAAEVRSVLGRGR